MAELRKVDPKTLIIDPNNPRVTPTSAAADDQLMASIKAVGLIQPPFATPTADGLLLKIGKRRVAAAIRAGLTEIDVLVGDADEANDAMRALAENVARAAMTSVDTWRAIDSLEKQNWTEQAIADALAIPVRLVRKLKLLAHLHPAMLDVMALGSTPNEDQLRTIAMATREEQAQVWKKYKPKKGQTEVAWYEVARALSKRRISASMAKFGDDLAKAYKVQWHDDLFAPAGEESRYTTDVDGFFGAQQEWLQHNLPAGATLLVVDDNGTVVLPKKAIQVYGKPGKGDITGYYVHSFNGAVETRCYRLPEKTKAAKAGSATSVEEETPVAKTRAEVTQKGVAIIGDLRTDALREAILKGPIEDDTLLGLLILAFGASNVSVESGSSLHRDDRQAICRDLIAGGVLTADIDVLRQAARKMVAGVLSCRADRTNSGPFARVAGETVGASLRLPNMATEDFLSCLSKGALEAVATGTGGVNIAPRAKDTRARMVEHFKDGIFVHPAALFQLSPTELEEATKARPARYSWETAITDGEEDADADNLGASEESGSNPELEQEAA